MGQYSMFIMLAVMFILLYLLMIRPQKKRERETKEMRASLRAGDEITTIGGIVGKIAKVKDESIIILVGPNKVKMEVMTWGVSRVNSQGPGSRNAKTTDEKKPKRMRSKADDDIEDQFDDIDEEIVDVEEVEEVAEAEAEETVEAEVEETAEEVVEAAEESEE